MNNIFEGAKFGDKFVTRGYLGVEDSRIAIFWNELENRYGEKVYSLILNEEDVPFYYDENGRYVDLDSNGNITPYGNEEFEYIYDIVSRYQEPIDEDKLDELAYDECPFLQEDKCYDSWIDGFKTGYRKTKE